MIRVHLAETFVALDGDSFFRLFHEPLHGLSETGDRLPLITADGKCALIDQPAKFGSDFSNSPILGGGEKFLVNVPGIGHPVMGPVHRDLVIAVIVCRYQLQVVGSAVLILETLAELVQP